LRGNTAKQAFRLLKEGQNDIERELGSLEWQELPEGQDCRIVDYLQDFDPRNRQDWDRGFGWLKKRTEEFRSVFGIRVKQLTLEEDNE
jgi:hypothetical protein